MRYCLSEHDAEKRNHDTYIVEARRADLLNKERPVNKCTTVRGTKGTTVLTDLAVVDCVWETCDEYMHASVLGIEPQLWGAWTDSKCPLHLMAKQRDIVNNRLVALLRPSEMYRLPKLLKNKKSWYAADWLY